MRFRLAGWSLALLALLCAAGGARADDVTGAQRRAAEEYLAALASGSAQAVGYAIHPSELDRLRITIVQRLRSEAAQGGSTQRTRLFGAAMPLSEVEKLTSLTFFQAVARRLVWRGRIYESVKGLAAVRDGTEQVRVLVKGRPPKDRGTIEVTELVTLLPYGKEWKAALPADAEAQLDDLLAGRGAEARAGGGASGGAGAGFGDGVGDAAAVGAGSVSLRGMTSLSAARPQVVVMATASASISGAACLWNSSSRSTGASPGTASLARAASSRLSTCSSTRSTRVKRADSASSSAPGSVRASANSWRASRKHCFMASRFCATSSPR